MNTKIISLALLACLCSFALAAPGDLDPSFNGTGKVTTAIGSGDDTGYGIAVQSDGKIVVAGQSYNGSNLDFALVRYNADGTLDTSFNGTGKVTTAIGSSDDYGESVVVQSDGKIVMAGFSHGTNGLGNFALVRYNANGSLDTTFNGTGKVTTDFGIGFDDRVLSVAVESDGKIVAAGVSITSGTTSKFALARYNANGTLDTSFNGTGMVTTAIGSGSDTGRSVAVQSDGKIVVAGDSYNGSNYDFAVVRYNTNGTLDASFNSTGKVITPIGSSDDVAYGVALQSDGKIVVSGFSRTTDADFAVVRYLANGALDTSFNGTGKVTTILGSYDSVGRGMAVLTDGKILVAGYAYTSGNSNSDFALVRYSSNGALDTNFTGTGKVITPIGSGDDVGYGLALQSDGKIVLAGSSYNGSNSDFAVVRYLASDPPAVSTATPTAVTGTSATLEGAVNPSGVASTYYFEYGPTNLYGGTTPVQNLPAGSLPVNVSANITGLTPGATYHYRVVASNAGGTVPTMRGDGDMSFQATPSGGENPTAVPTVTTGGVSNVTATGVTVAGTVNPNGGTTLAQVEYGTTTSYGSVSGSQSYGNGTTVTNVALPVNGLQPLTTYHYRVIASNSLTITTNNGTPSQGADMTFTTAGIPPEVHTTAATAVASTSAALNAHLISNTGSTSVAFLYGSSAEVLDQIAPVPGSFPAGLATQAVTVVLPKGTLTANSTYYYRAIATSGAGTSSATEVASFTTQNVAPSAVPDVFFIAGQDQTLDVLVNDTDPDLPNDVLSLTSAFTQPSFTAPDNSTVVAGSVQKISVQNRDALSFSAKNTFTDQASFTYTIADLGGLTSTATVSLYRFTALRGIYSGTVQPNGNGGLPGALRLAVNASAGRFTGVLFWEGGSYAVDSILAPDGSVTLGIPGTALQFTLRVIDPLAGTIGGTLIDNTLPSQPVTAAISLQREDDGSSEDSTSPTPGKYTTLIDDPQFVDPLGSVNAPSEAQALVAQATPTGTGFSFATIGPKKLKRRARFATDLADGSRFSAGSGLAGRTYTLAQTLYRIKTGQSGGSFNSQPTFPNGDNNRFRSDSTWIKTAIPNAPGSEFFPGGFRLRLLLAGLPYSGKRVNPIVFPDNHTKNAQITLSGGGLSGPKTYLVSVDSRSRVMTGDTEIKMQMNKAGGTFTGSFKHPGEAKPVPFIGMFQQSSDLAPAVEQGLGYFRAPTLKATGRVQITAH